MEHTKMIIEIGLEGQEKEYTLEIDRKSIIHGEEVLGFDITQVGNQIISQAYKSFAMGLQKNHKKLTIEERFNLLDQYLEEGGEIMDVVSFIAEQVSNFLQPTNTNTKAKKKKKPRFE